MFETSALELVLLFLVAVIGIPSIALAVVSVTEAVVLAIRVRDRRATALMRMRTAPWLDRAGGDL